MTKEEIKNYILNQYDQTSKAYQKCKEDIQTSNFIAGIVYGLTLVYKEIIKDESQA